MRSSFLRGFDRVDEIAHQRFGALLPVQLRDRAIERIAGELLDQRALRRNHQRGLVRHDRDAGRQRRGDAEEQHQQHDQMQHLAQRIERAPHKAEEGGNGFHRRSVEIDASVRQRVGNAVDRAGGVVGEQHRAVLQHQQVDRPAEYFIAAIEAGGERLVLHGAALPSSFTRVMR